MSTNDSLKLFALTSQMIEHDLDQVEGEYAVDLRRGHRGTLDTDAAYYPQIESAIRAEASLMAPHYEVFYSLESTIRALIADSLSAEFESSWWEDSVPDAIKDEVRKRKEKEAESGVTPRSDEPIDYTTFGELGEIIKSNWDVFGAIFSNVRAVQKVMASLNTLRGPIAHCSPLAEDEVVRLQLTVRDWFRLME